MDRKEIAGLFPVKKNYLYFNFAADGPLPVTAKETICNALEEKSGSGLMAVDKQISVFEDIREELSTLFKTKKENFAFIKNTSEGVLLALLALDIKEDENYIAAGDAFPTTVRMMESNCKGKMRKVSINAAEPMEEQLLNVIDSKTRAIVLDWVHYFTGKVIDIEAVVRLAAGRGIFTVIDGIQGAGALNIQLEDSGIDFFMAGGHKWLLSPQGSGFIYVADRVWERIQRKSFGWLGYNWLDFSDFSIEPGLREGAAVMEFGTRPYMTAAGFLECLKIINRFGIKNIEKHNRELREFFTGEISRKGFRSIINEKSASIVPFKRPDTDSRLLKKNLHENKVILSLRSGYIRAAFHFINDLEEVERFVDFL